MLNIPVRILALAVLASPTMGQADLVGIDTSFTTSRLLRIDPTTGAATVVGTLSGVVDGIGALTYDPVHRITYFASTGDDSLYTLDLTTLTATMVGPFNVGSAVTMHGLEYVPTTGQLIGRSWDQGLGVDLFTIDAGTGQATGIGFTGVTSAGGIAWANGEMYLVDLSGRDLLTVDLTTAATTLVGPYGFSLPGSGLAYSATYGMLGSNNLSASLSSFDLATGSAQFLGSFGIPSNVISLAFVDLPIGTSYCSANANSTGAPATIHAFGSAVAASNSVVLTALDLPLNSAGFFITSQTQGFVAGPSGSQGNLCIAGSIGRYVAPGQVQNSGASGSFSLSIDLTQTPTPTGLVTALANETWNFQAWHRDAVGGTPTSNFTDAVSVVFQ